MAIETLADRLKKLQPETLADRLARLGPLSTAKAGATVTRDTWDSKREELKRQATKDIFYESMPMFPQSEAAINVATGLTSMAPAVISQSAKLQENKGKSFLDAEEEAARVGEKYTYQPKTKSGQLIGSAVSQYGPWTLPPRGLDVIAKIVAPNNPEMQAKIRTGGMVGLGAGMGVAGLVKRGSLKVPKPFRVVEKAVQPVGTTQNIETGFQKFKRQWQDRQAGLRRMESIATKEGVKIQPGMSPMGTAQRYAGVGGMAEARLWNKFRKHEPTGKMTVVGESLKSILDDAKKVGKPEDFSRYVKNSAALEAEGLGQKTGLDINTMRAEIAQDSPRFEPIRKRLTDFQNNLLDDLADSGRISAEEATFYKNKYQAYAPLNRVFLEETKGHIPAAKNAFTKTPKPIRARKGSELEIVDPLEKIVEKTYTLTSAAERAKVGRNIMNLAKQSKGVGEIIFPSKPRLDSIFRDGKRHYFPARQQPKGTAEFWENGRKTYWNVPEDVYSALSNVDEASLGIMGKVLALPAKLVRTGATTAPGFMLKNPMRDMQTAFVSSKVLGVPIYDQARGLANFLKKDDLFWEWKAAGGDLSIMQAIDQVSNKSTLRKLLGHRDYVRYLNPLRALEDVSMTTEKMTRIGTYRRARTKLTELESALESREASGEFSQHGSSMKPLSSTIPFLNARIQIFNKTLRSFKERPVATGLKALAITLPPTLIAYAVNRNNPYYHEQPAWRKRLFWCIPINAKKDRFLYIPKGEMGIVLGSTIESVLTFADSSNKYKPEVDKLLLQVAGDISPVGGIGDILPSIAKTPIELATNYDFFRNKPIVTEYRKTLPEYQETPYTSETSKALGKAVGLSPAKVEHGITGWTAGLGRLGIQLSDKIGGMTGLLPKRPKMPSDVADYPGVSSVLSRPFNAFASESTNRFYEVMDTVERVSNSASELKRQGKVDELKSMVNKNRKYWPVFIAPSRISKQKTFFSDLTTAKTNLAKIRQAYYQAMQSDKIGADEKKAIQENTNKIVMSIIAPLLERYDKLTSSKGQEQ